jgi:hypothetical protein
LASFIALYLSHEWHAFNAVLLATSRSVAKVTVTTLGATSRAHNLHTITVRAGKSIMLFRAPFDIYHDAVATRVM